MGRKEVRQLQQNQKEKQSCKETRAEMGEACKVAKLKGHGECVATKLNRWGQLGFCGLHKKVLTENQIAVCS